MENNKEKTPSEKLMEPLKKESTLSECEKNLTDKNIRYMAAILSRTEDEIIQTIVNSIPQ